MRLQADLSFHSSLNQRGPCSSSLADPHLLFSLLSLSMFPGPGSAVSALLGVSTVGQAIKVICCRDGSRCDWHHPKIPDCAPVTGIYYKDLGPPGNPLQFSRSQSGSMSTVTISGVQAQDKVFCQYGNYQNGSDDVTMVKRSNGEGIQGLLAMAGAC